MIRSFVNNSVAVISAGVALLLLSRDGIPSLPTLSGLAALDSMAWQHASMLCSDIVCLLLIIAGLAGMAYNIVASLQVDYMPLTRALDILRLPWARRVVVALFSSYMALPGVATRAAGIQMTAHGTHTPAATSQPDSTMHPRHGERVRRQRARQTYKTIGAALVYTVQTGDTMAAIAQRIYGSAAAYVTIFRASRDLIQPDGRTITDPGLLYPGQHLHLPLPATNITVQGERATYIVQSGDTLSGIAGSLYGDWHVYPELVAANAHSIHDDNVIYPGEKLDLPAMLTTTSTATLTPHGLSIRPDRRRARLQSHVRSRRPGARGRETDIRSRQSTSHTGEGSQAHSVTHTDQESVGDERNEQQPVRRIRSFSSAKAKRVPTLYAHPTIRPPFTDLVLPVAFIAALFTAAGIALLRRRDSRSSGPTGSVAELSRLEMDGREGSRATFAAACLEQAARAAELPAVCIRSLLEESNKVSVSIAHDGTSVAHLCAALEAIVGVPVSWTTGMDNDGIKSATLSWAQGPVMADAIPFVHPAPLLLPIGYDDTGAVMHINVATAGSMLIAGGAHGSGGFLNMLIACLSLHVTPASLRVIAACDNSILRAALERGTLLAWDIVDADDTAALTDLVTRVDDLSMQRFNGTAPDYTPHVILLEGIERLSSDHTAHMVQALAMQAHKYGLHLVATTQDLSALRERGLIAPFMARAAYRLTADESRLLFGDERAASLEGAMLLFRGGGTERIVESFELDEDGLQEAVETSVQASGPDPEPLVGMSSVSADDGSLAAFTVSESLAAPPTQDGAKHTDHHDNQVPDIATNDEPAVTIAVTTALLEDDNRENGASIDEDVAEISEEIPGVIVTLPTRRESKDTMAVDTCVTDTTEESAADGPIVESHTIAHPALVAEQETATTHVAGSHPAVFIRLFDDVCVLVNGVLLTRLQAMQRALLATLVVKGPHPVPHEELSALLWPHDVPGRDRLDRLLSSTRTALRAAACLPKDKEYDPLPKVQNGYVLNPRVIDSDVAAFRRAADQLAALDDDAVSTNEYPQVLATLITTYRGPLWRGDAGHWILGPRHDLHQTYTDALRRRAEWYADEKDDLNEALRWAKRWCDEEEVSEDAARLVIEILGRKGDEIGLKSFYTEFSSRFARRLGGQPLAPVTTNVYTRWMRRIAEQRTGVR